MKTLLALLLLIPSLSWGEIFMCEVTTTIYPNFYDRYLQLNIQHDKAETEMSIVEKNYTSPSDIILPPYVGKAKQPSKTLYILDDQELTLTTIMKLKGFKDQKINNKLKVVRHVNDMTVFEYWPERFTYEEVYSEENKGDIRQLMLKRDSNDKDRSLTFRNIRIKNEPVPYMDFTILEYGRCS